MCQESKGFSQFKTIINVLVISFASFEYTIPVTFHHEQELITHVSLALATDHDYIDF